MKPICIFLLLGVFFLTSCQQDDLRKYDSNEQSSVKKNILWMIKNVNNDVQTKAVGVKGKFWNPGDTIRIKFLNGSQTLRQQVKQYAGIWLQYANLYFKYVEINENADVKIGFDLDTLWLAWSTIGTDCKAIPQDEPSLNFVYLDYEDETGVQAEVLRGFGHVLGLGFEHKNPNSSLRFKGSDQQFLDEYNLSGQRLAEFKQLYTTDQTNYTEYDKNSIMTVAIPRSLVVMPPMATNRNTTLSDLDKSFIAKLYSQALVTVKWFGRSIVVTVASVGWPVAGGSSDVTRIVDWGDGHREAVTEDGSFNHNYGYEKEYTIRFFGSDTCCRLVYFNGGVRAMDVSNCPELLTLYCDNSPLESIDISHNPKLRLLSLWKNSLTSLDVTYNPALTQLTCTGNSLTSLDVTHNPALVYLWCEDNQIQTLNISRNPALRQLSCYGNPFADDSVRLIVVASNLPSRVGQAERGTLIVRDTFIRNAVRSTCERLNWETIVLPRRTNYRLNHDIYERRKPYEF